MMTEPLEDAMRRAAGRKLLEVAERVHAAGIPPMTDEEVVAEIKAVRAEQRALASMKPPRGAFQLQSNVPKI